MYQDKVVDDNVSRTGSRPPVGATLAELRLPSGLRHLIGVICAWELLALYGPRVRGRRLPTGSHLAHRYKGHAVTGVIGVSLGMLAWHLLVEVDRD